eukprot:1260299-Prymnesium_polylepis.1
MVINAIVWMVVAVWVPWGVWAPRLGRPICDQGVDDDMYLFYKKTQGGWKPDTSCLFLEVMVILAQVFILFAIPVARKCAADDASFNTRAYHNKDRDQTSWIGVIRTARGNCMFIFATVVGLIVIITGNAFSSSLFGDAWARAVAGESVPWNERTIAGFIYDMNIGVIVSVLAGGFVLAVVVGRWMFESFTCESLQIFVVWIIFAMGAFLPIITFYSVTYFTDKNRHTDDCEIFPEGGDYNSERNSCDVRWFVVATGTALLGLVVVVMAFLGLVGSLRSGACCKPVLRTLGEVRYATQTGSSPNPNPNRSDEQRKLLDTVSQASADDVVVDCDYNCAPPTQRPRRWGWVLGGS